MLFAFSGVGLGLIAIGAAIGIYGGITQIQAGNEARSAANQSAEMQAAAANMAAATQIMAAKAQAQEATDQAELARMQANIEDKKAGVAQEQGQIEAAKRSRLLAYDIGNIYAQWAGNGLLVDGGNDTLGSLIASQTREAAQDLTVIRTNTANSVWEHSMNKSSALLTAHSYESAAENYELMGQANALGTLVSGNASAFQTRQQGMTAYYQGLAGGIGSIGSGIASIGVGLMSFGSSLGGGGTSSSGSGGASSSGGGGS